MSAYTTSNVVKITGLDQATEEVRAAVHQGVVNGLTSVGVVAQRYVVNNIRNPYENMPPAVATGNFANSIDFKVTPAALLSQMLVFAGAPADVYADPMNYGSKAHMMPVDALLPWVKLKFGVDDEKAALKIAWPIALSMAKKGVQARHMFDRAQANAETNAPSILERSIADTLRAAGLAGGSLATY